MKKPVQYFMHCIGSDVNDKLICICNDMQCKRDTIIFGLCTGKEVAVDSVTMPHLGSDAFILYICMQI